MLRFYPMACVAQSACAWTGPASAGAPPPTDGTTGTNRHPGPHGRWLAQHPSVAPSRLGHSGPLVEASTAHCPCRREFRRREKAALHSGDLFTQYRVSTGNTSWLTLWRSGPRCCWPSSDLLMSLSMLSQHCPSAGGADAAEAAHQQGPRPTGPACPALAPRSYRYPRRYRRCR